MLSAKADRAEVLRRPLGEAHELDPALAELNLAALWTHLICLLLAYAGPALLLFAP